MPSRLRQAAGRQSVEAAQDDGPYRISGLSFNQALTWRAGKAIAVAELLSRLQNLGSELRGVEQGQISAKEIRQLAQDLAHSNLLGHKDKGIRAWALCCIVDILNICAPDAPFNPGQLRDIFKVVNNLLQNLDDPSNAYNAQHVYVLNSLTDTKSIVLITDLERSEELITPLFRICFDIVSGAGQNAGGHELAKSVEFQLRSMLVTIIDEASLSQEVIDVILSQFLRVDPRTQEPVAKTKRQDVKDRRQDTLHLKDYPPAYNMAKSICTTCTEKMTAYVTQYVGTIIMNASSALSDEGPSKHHGRRTSEIDDSDEDEETLTDLRKAHRLVRELWRACPDVLLNVISQIEAELHADSVSLRQLATETLGDIIAGIGIAGPPPTTTLDPAAYPLPSITTPEPPPISTNPLLIPASPKPFGSIHSTAFSAFLGRRIDKSSLVRSAWTVAVSRILQTDAGGIGINSEHRQIMMAGYAQMLKDIDDKVRQTAVQTIANFTYHAIVNVLGSDGGLAVSGSILSTLADRPTDRKHTVREDAISILGQIWGTGSANIQNAVEKVQSILGDIPSRILHAMYTNDLHIHMQLDKVLYESILPITFPPVKTGAKAESQKRSRTQSQDTQNIDADKIRVERILTLVRGLDVKARQVFFGIQKRQVEMSKAMKVFLVSCENYNGGVVDNDNEEQQIKDQLSKYVQAISKRFPDSSKASADLWKFIKMHDRRNYQLIRFATEPEHDFRTMSKAIKELIKRIGEGTPSTQAIMDTLQPLLYRSASIVYNRSHVPAIMDISRTDQDGLADVAHEVLKEISAQNPEVLKTHIQALCRELEEHAPSAASPENSSAADTLKACAGFARKYPIEVPKDRKFLTAMTNYALFSHASRAAKHAVTIILTVSDKKELHAKELMTKALKDCNSKSDYYLARLATISQVCLLAPSAANSQEDAILEVAVTNCLHQNQSPAGKNDPNAWDQSPTDETLAKQYALKIMVNRCRAANEKSNQSDFDLLANNVLTLLMKLIENDGEIAPSADTPPAQRNRLRLTAAHYLLKLCSHKHRCEELVTPQMFIAVALIVINPPNAVRSAFVHQLQKYLGRSSLHLRWYTILFLVAFEPDVELKSRTVAWLKSRVSFFERQQKRGGPGAPNKTTVMETIFARLLSLLAHHPDYPDPNTAEFESELLDFARYIVFYLQCVATEESISFIFHIAQRVKQVRDAVSGTEESSERLYVLSDLAQAVIKNYADMMPAHAKGVNLLQSLPGRAALPTNLFSSMSNSTIAQEVAAKNYLPEDVAVGLEKLVRSMVRGGKSKDRQKATTTGKSTERKRKSDSVDGDISDAMPSKNSKRARKSSTLPIRKTPKSVKRKVRDDGEMSVEQPSRKSARTSNIRNYAESDDGDDDHDDKIVSSPIKLKSKPAIMSSKGDTGLSDSDAGGEANEDTSADEETELEAVMAKQVSSDDNAEDAEMSEVEPDASGDDDGDDDLEEKDQNEGDDEDMEDTPSLRAARGKPVPEQIPSSRRSARGGKSKVEGAGSVIKNTSRGKAKANGTARKVESPKVASKTKTKVTGKSTSANAKAGGGKESEAAEIVGNTPHATRRSARNAKA